MRRQTATERGARPDSDLSLVDDPPAEDEVLDFPRGAAAARKAMERLTRKGGMAQWSPSKGVAWVLGGLAWLTAAAIGAVLAVFFAATMVVIAIMATALLAVAGMALRARRTVRSGQATDIIEARNIGGHSWVAYGWDGRR
jgi:hypothetical protein